MRSFIDVDQMHLHRRRTNLHLQLFLLFPLPALSTIPTADVADLVGTKAAPHLLSSSSSTSSVELDSANLKFLMPTNSSSVSQFRQ
jgi:hypothetical protein